MSTVKISELALITQLNANTSNTLFLAVDIPTGVTGKFTGHTLAQGLYSNEVLNVGNNAIVYQNVIGQFSGNSGTYLQINNQNFDANGSSDYVASTNDSDNTNNYIDMGINGSNFSDVTYSSMKPYDGYVYSHGPSHLDYRGNLVIGTASSTANIVLIAGGTTSANIVGRIGANIFDFLKNVRVTGTIAPSGGIVFSDGTTLTTSTPAAATYANGAFIQANAAFLVANTPTHVANSAALYANGAFLVANTPTHVANSAALYANAAFIQANAAFITANTPTHVANSAALYANAAFAKANSALANTSGAIFAGNLNILGNVTMLGVAAAGQLTVNTSLTSATEAAVRITGSNNAVVIEPQNGGYMLQITGKENLPTRVVLDSFGANTYGLLAGRSARGTASTPTATQSGDVLLRLAGNGYGTTGFAPLGVSRIDIVAAENFTDAARGSKILFYNVPNGSNTVTEIASFNADTVTFTGVVSPEKGFIYTPRIPAGNQTAITINYATDSTIKANLVADLTVSHSNFITGKVVEMWLVNTGGAARTITHGISALNSTTNSTTFTIAGTSSAYLKFFSIDGDLANTFVSVVYA